MRRPYNNHRPIRGCLDAAVVLWEAVTVQETIQKMVQVESQARQLVEQAEAAAKSLLVSTQLQVQKQKADALQAAKNQAQQTVESTVSQARDEKEKELQRQRQVIAQTIRVGPEQIEASVAEVQRAVLGL